MQVLAQSFHIGQFDQRFFKKLLLIADGMFPSIKVAVI